MPKEGYVVINRSEEYEYLKERERKDKRGRPVIKAASYQYEQEEEKARNIFFGRVKALIESSATEAKANPSGYIGYAVNGLVTKDPGQFGWMLEKASVSMANSFKVTMYTKDLHLIIGVVEIKDF